MKQITSVCGLSQVIVFRVGRVTLAVETSRK